MLCKLFHILFITTFLCACQGGYRNYLPAPHEMSTNAVVGQTKNYVPEEQINVQESQSVAPDVLQALMKARGYSFIGQRTIRSEYSPSLSDIRKAAYEIGASQAIYFPTNKEVTREEKSKIEIGNFISDMIGATNEKGVRSAIKKVVKPRKYLANTTYYTYNITYWTKNKNIESTILTTSETMLLQNEQKKLKNDVQQLEKKLATLEKKTSYTNKKNVNVVYKHDNISKSETDDLKNELQAAIAQLNEYNQALAQNNEKLKSINNRKPSNPIPEDYDIYKNQ